MSEPKRKLAKGAKAHSEAIFANPRVQEAIEASVARRESQPPTTMTREEFRKRVGVEE